MFHRSFLMAALATPLLAWAAAAAPGDAAPRSVIRAARSVPPGVTLPQGRGVVRAAYVEVDPGSLASGRRLAMELFDRVPQHAILKSIGAGLHGAQIFEGEIDGEPGSSVALSVIGDEMFGNIKSGGRWYQIRAAGKGAHTIVEMDASAMPPSLDPLLPPVEASVATVRQSDAVAADDGSMIDVLVMYTPAAKTFAGGATAIANLINLAIAETNTAYQNSGVNQRVRLVHMQETVDNPDGLGYNAALAALQAPSDGVMDEVHAARDLYGADAVALIINNFSSCGIAYVMTFVNASFASSAFSVTDVGCATGYYSFGHELGHNMGLAHDRANSNASGAYSYAYGWQDPQSAFRTVMAYNCPVNCTRVQHFSNPNVNYLGKPTGSPVGTPTEAHNAQALNNTALVFSNFRASVVPVAAAPANVAALGDGASVSVTWNLVTGATLYEVQRRGAGGAFATVGTIAGPPYLDATVMADQAYLYHVRALTPTGNSAYSTADLATTVAFTDEPLVAGTTTIKAAHLTQLRTAVNAIRALAGLGAAAYTDAAAAGLPVKAQHVIELRTSLDAALSALSIATSAYGAGASASSVVQAAHFQELRTRTR